MVASSGGRQRKCIIIECARVMIPSFLNESGEAKNDRKTKQDKNKHYRHTRIGWDITQSKKKTKNEVDKEIDGRITPIDCR